MTSGRRISCDAANYMLNRFWFGHEDPSAVDAAERDRWQDGPEHWPVEGGYLQSAMHQQGLVSVG